jgi:CelD/BcsL family acetyltransferase involved in cellulose biosynthesis
MDVREFSDLSDPELARSWSALEEAGACANVFATRAWVSLWSRRFATRAVPLIVVGYDTSGPVALAPLFSTPEGTVELPVNFLSPRGEFLMLDGRSDGFVPRALALLRSRPARPVFRSVPTRSRTFERLASCARGAGYLFNARPVRSSPCLDVDGSWDAFLESVPRRRAARWAKQYRRLEREGKVRVTVWESGSDAADAAGRFTDLEARSWKERQGTSIRGRGLEDFYREIVSTMSVQGWMRSYSLELNRRTIAFALGALYRGTHFILKTSYDEAYGKLSPGVCLFYQVVRRDFDDGVSLIDFLGEESRWKNEWASGRTEHAHVRLYPISAEGLFRYAVDAGARPLARRILGRGNARSGRSAVGPEDER